MRTTFPRRPTAESGCELSHAVALPSEGNSPSRGNGTAAGCLTASKSWFIFMMSAFPMLGCAGDGRSHHGSAPASLGVSRASWFGKRPTNHLGRPPVQLTAATALRITSVTACGCEIMITWEPSTSMIVAPARRAMERTTSLPAALSPLATTAQEGKVFQAGTPDGSENAPSATGRCGGHQGSLLGEQVGGEGIM